MYSVRVVTEFRGHRFTDSSPRCLDCPVTYAEAVVFDWGCAKKEAS